jgi:uncharacterized protein YukE
MADKIRMNYPVVKDMASQCLKLYAQLDSIAFHAKDTSAQMEEGALLGKPGETFVQAMGQLERSTRKLQAKLYEVAQDIEKAMADMQQADGTSGSKF